MLIASEVSPSQRRRSMAVTFQLPDQIFQFFKIVACQALAFRQMRDQGRGASAEKLVGEMLRGAAGVSLAGDFRTIEIASAVRLMSDGAFFHETGKKRLYGFETPAGFPGQPVGDRRRRQPS